MQTDLPSPNVDVPTLVRRTSALLHAGVPLTLLLDLSEPAGPASRSYYRAEWAATDWIPEPR